MSQINLFSLNLVDQSNTTITANSEDSFFPVSNLQDYRSTKVFRTAVGTTTANVVFDFGSIEDVDSILLKASNITPKGFTGSITIEANATDSWGSPSYSTTMSYNSTFNLAFKLLTGAESYRFWRITASSDSYVELSNIFIGKRENLGRNIDFNWRYTDFDRSKDSENRYGQKFIDQTNFQKRINASISLLTQTQVENIMDIFTLNGLYNPIWIIVDPDEQFATDAERFAGQFFFTTSPSYTNIAYQIYNVSLSFEEAT